MKSARIFTAAMAALLLLTSCSGGDTAKTSPTAEGTAAPGYSGTALTSETAKLLGRTYEKDGVLWTAYSGSGAEFIYNGQELNITVIGDTSVAGAAESRARIGIYLDGERVVDDMIDKVRENYRITADEASSHIIRIVKLSESGNSVFGISPIELSEGETILPTEEKPFKIEFIGDSITCGYGVDDEDRNHHFSTETEDVTRAYAYKVAELLDADYSIVAMSGHGIISGYTGDGTKQAGQIIPKYYTTLGFSYGTFGGVSPHSIEWDFDRFTPDAVVINLGTNDASYCNNDERKAEYEAGYVEFLKTVREKNPEAYIFCTLGVMGTQLNPNAENAVNTYISETGDERVIFFGLPQQDMADGIAADWHPTEATHQKSAELVAAVIKETLGL